MKKILILLLVIILNLTACSLFSSSPSAVVKKLISNAESGNINGMVALWSDKGIKEIGADTLRKNSESFSDLCQSQIKQGQHLSVEKLRETVNGDRARVFFIYGDRSKNNTVGMGFALLKENGAWKIFRGIDIGEEDSPFDSSFEDKSKTENPTEISTPDPSLNLNDIPPPPEEVAKNKNSSNGNMNGSQTSPSAITISANDLYNDYKKDQNAADQKYKGKSVRVSGEVFVATEKSMTGEPIAAFKVDGKDGVSGKFQQSQKQAVGNLKIGEKKTFKCTVNGALVTGTFYGVILENCVVE